MTENEIESLQFEVHQYKQIVEEILYMTVVGGNGGYYSDFGPALFSRMLKITGYDPKNRRIVKLNSKKERNNL